MKGRWLRGPPERLGSAKRLLHLEETVWGGLLPDEMCRQNALEDENSQLKKMVADMTLDREMSQDVIRRKLVRPKA